MYRYRYLIIMEYKMLKISFKCMLKYPCVQNRPFNENIHAK